MTTTISSQLEKAMTILRAVQPLKALLRIAFVGLGAIVISGLAHILFHPAVDPSPRAKALIGSLTEGEADASKIPTDFEARMGYVPQLPDGNLARPDGSCSTPNSESPVQFELACRVHDLGYDTLRYAEATDQRLGPWARYEVDRKFYRDLRASCDNAGCRTSAAMYYLAVTANSVRQGYQAPTDEPTLPWAGLLVIVVGLGVAPSVAGLSRLLRPPSAPRAELLHRLIPSRRGFFSVGNFGA